MRRTAWMSAFERSGEWPVMVELRRPQRRQLPRGRSHNSGNSGSTAFEQALRARSFEKLERIAGVLAVWDNPSAPTMRVDHVEWALKAVEASDAAVIRFTTDHMHDGEVQANAAMGANYPSESFRVLKEKEIRHLGEYRTRRLVLEAWDRMEQGEL